MRTAVVPASGTAGEAVLLAGEKLQQRAPERDPQPQLSVRVYRREERCEGWAVKGLPRISSEYTDAVVDEDTHTHRVPPSN